MSKQTATYYNRKKTPPVTAIQLKFDVPEGITHLFKYQKWGDTQQCKPNDWLVRTSVGEVYTIDEESFAKTYTTVSGDSYEKSVGVYAYQSTVDGSIPTKEGVTHYKAGDWVTFNDKELTDGYAISDEKFRKLYEV
jgi:hypothetical protein